MEAIVPTIEEIRAYLVETVKSFDRDAADSEFQRGYRAHAESMLEDLFMTQDERRLARSQSHGSA